MAQNGRSGYVGQRSSFASATALGSAPAVLGKMQLPASVKSTNGTGLLDMDDTHVTFRWKDRNRDTWQTERILGVQFLRRFLQHVLPRGFHRCRYYGLWHSSRRDLSNRAWLLLILQKPTDAAVPITIAQLLDVLRQPGEDEEVKGPHDDDRTPCCPHCGSMRITLLDELPRSGMT